MSAVTQNPVGEVPQVVPTFSYAQAAKGISPSVPSPLPSGKALSETIGTNNRRTSIPDSKTASIVSDRPVAKRTASEGRESHGGDFKSRVELDDVPSKFGEAAAATTSLLGQPQAEGHDLTVASTPSSPGFGTASTSTLPKEDDMFSTPNGSSDSTWEKQSQTSQNGTKNEEKVDAEKEQSAGNTWDEEPTPSVSLKEAPPPAVNFWKQRKEAQDAKAKASKQASTVHNLKPAISNVGHGNTNGAPKSSDHIVDLKKQDSKKKAKGNVGPLEERAGPGAFKDGNKLAEARTRSGEEGGPHRSARSPEAGKPVAVAIVPPPPPGDAISWPTPDSAQGEEKKKAHERVEKGDKTPTMKPHGKEKWMPVPYVPSAVFNTPLPNRRGGRLARGREGGTRGGGFGHGTNANHGGHGLEKQVAGQTGESTSTVLDGVSERGRADLSPPKNASSSRPKRAVSAGPPTTRERRKTADSVSTDKRNEADVLAKPGNQNGPARNEFRRTSAAAQTEIPQTAHNYPASNGATHAEKPVHVVTVKDERRQSVPHDTHAHPRSAGPERRSEGSMRPPDYSRDYHGYMPIRERGEGRSERGRGGLRGRGGNNGFSHSTIMNGHGFANGHPYQYQSSVPPQPTKTHSNHERHAAQPHGSFQSSQSHGRHYRSSSRSQSIPHSAPYGRYQNGPHPGAPNLPNIQTDLANQYGYQPGNQGIMSAMPYNAYMEQASLFGMVSMQMEYYFSVDNLCKDMFLRKHMDSQGFVFLSVLAKFNRIKQLTPDTELIKYVCLNSPKMEFRQGSDGIDRLRKREGWQQWVLNMEERDPTAQNDGITPAQQPRILHIPMADVPNSYENRQGTLPKFNGAGPRDEVGQYLPPDGIPPPFVPFAPSAMPNGNFSNASVTQTPLSAAVPDFAPGMPSLNTRSLSLDASPHGTSSFTDEQVESLMIVVRKPVNTLLPLPPPFHSQSSRTFSNGSIDGRTIHDELFKLEERQPRSKTNDDSASDFGDLSRSQRSRSPFSLGSPSRQGNSSVSPVFWVKDKDTPIDSLPSDLTHESYNIFRRNALKQREQVGAGNCHRDMDILYQFWSHFLIRNFNTRMYEEFRQVAFEDAKQHDSMVGIKNLVQYYDESILGQKVISDEIARDFVNLVQDDNLGTKRLAFDKLRAAWRNGAFNLKNRKKIGDIVDAELKAELER